MSDMYVVEMESAGGYRYWSKPMPESEIPLYVEAMESFGDSYSDCATAFIYT